MNAQQLKNSILQEAIEGRLVPQDPNDEPASVLLDKIRKEKAKLVKEGKLKKKDLEETPIAEDEIPFEIPESWEWCRLNWITELIEDCPHSTAPDEGEGYPLIRTSNIGFGKLNLEGVHRVSETTYNKRNERAIPQPLDLIYAREATAGNIAVIEEGQKVCLGQRTVLVRPMKKLIDSRWLAYVVLSPYSYKTLVGSSTGTTVAHVNLSDFRPFKFPLPPLAEQKRIVEKIEELLPKVEEYGKAQEALDKLNEDLPERLKKSILQEAIEGRLVPQDPNDEPASVLLDKIRAEKKRLVKEGKLKKKDLEETPISENEKPFEIPESWEWARLSNVVNIIMGQSPDGADVYESEYDNSAYEFHQGKICFTERFISPSGKWCKNPSRLAEKGSLLVCVRAPIGDVNITQRIISIGRGLAAIMGYCGIQTLFLFFWMMAHKRILEDKGTGSTFKAITIEVLKNQAIPLPPLAEQKRIVKKIEQLMHEIDKLKM